MNIREQARELNTIYDEVTSELFAARQKFPSSNCCVAALMEEVGELTQAVLKVAAGKWPAERIREEGIQVMAMALRIMTEGDPSITNYVEPNQ